MRSRARWISATAATAAILAILSGPAVAEGTVSVVVDRAKVFRVDRPAGTIIIGNPAIADAVLNDPSTLIITGKAYGSTNLVILDKEGLPLVDEVIVVQPPETGVVTVHRSNQRFSYNCSPTCQPTMNMGDQDGFYKQAAEQAAQHSQFARGAGAPAGAN